MVSAHHNYESLREFDAIVYVYLETHSERQVTPERPATVFTFGASNSLDTLDGSASAPVTFLPAFSTVVNATVALTASRRQRASPASPIRIWGGANVWLSTDGISYQVVGRSWGLPARAF